MEDSLHQVRLTSLVQCIDHGGIRRGENVLCVRGDKFVSPQRKFQLQKHANFQKQKQYSMDFKFALQIRC